jgi:hypothetical protein
MNTDAKNLVSELLPCPFCGGNAKIGPEHPELDGDAWTQVYCANAECPFDPSVECFEDGHKESAIRIWNTRASMLEQAGDAVSEPVAWMSSGGDVSRSKLWCDERTGPNSMGPIPLYSHPPRDDGKVTGDLVHEAWLMLLNDYHARDRGEPDVSIARRVLEKSLGSIREKPVSVKKWKAPEVVGRITMVPDGDMASGQIFLPENYAGKFLYVYKENLPLLDYPTELQPIVFSDAGKVARDAIESIQRYEIRSAGDIYGGSCFFEEKDSEGDWVKWSDLDTAIKEQRSLSQSTGSSGGEK